MNFCFEQGLVLLTRFKFSLWIYFVVRCSYRNLIHIEHHFNGSSLTDAHFGRNVYVQALICFKWDRNHLCASHLEMTVSTNLLTKVFIETLETCLIWMVLALNFMWAQKTQQTNLFMPCHAMPCHAIDLWPISWAYNTCFILFKFNQTI